MKWLLILLGIVAAGFAVLIGLGVVGMAATSEERAALDAGAEKMQRVLHDEFDLPVGVSYQLQSSFMKGLKQTNVIVTFPMIPPTADLNAIVGRAVELSYEHMQWVTEVTFIGKDPRQKSGYRLTIQKGQMPPQLSR